MNEYEAMPERSLRQRVMRGLFPQTHLEPLPEAEGYAPGDYMTVTRVEVSWGDRLRLLVSGRAEVVVRSKTDVSISRDHAASVFNVLPPA